MMDYFVFTKAGTLDYFKLNDDLFERLNRIDVDGKFALADDKTNDIVATFETDAERERFFYVKTPIDQPWMIWQGLRNAVYLEQGVTLGNIRDAIEQTELLHTLLFILDSSFPEVFRYPPVNDKPAESLIVENIWTINSNNKLSSEIQFGYSTNYNWTDDTVVEIRDTAPLVEIENPQTPLVELQYAPSLLEFVSALFFIEGQDDACVLSSEGLQDVNGVVENPMQALLRPCTIDKDTTLLDIFKFVASCEPLKCFVKLYSWCNAIDDFHALAAQTKLEHIDDLELHYLEIFRAPELCRKHDYFSIDPQFEVICNNQEAKDDEPLVCSQAVDLRPVNELADLPVRLVKRLSLMIDVEGDVQTKNLDMGFTMLDILDAIYWEISFCGDPSQAAGTQQKVRKLLDDIQGF